MIEALTPYTAEESLTDGIRARGVRRGFNNLNVTRLRNPSEANAKLAVVIMDEVLRPHTKGGGFPKLLCSPSVSGDRVTPTWITLRECSSMMKKANSERKKRSVTGRKSQAQICSACVRKKVFQFCPCGRVVLTCRIYFCMVRLQTRIPNLSNSPCMPIS